MKDLMAIALHCMVHDEFEAMRSQDAVMGNIKKDLFWGCDKEDSKDEIYVKMIINAMEIAAYISLKSITDILLDAGVFAEIDDRRLRKIILSPPKQD